MKLELFIHGCDNPELRHIHDLLHQIIHNQEIQMAAIDDLKTVVTAIQGDVASLQTDVQNVLVILQSGSDTAVADAVTALKAVDTNLQGIHSSLAAVEVPPAV